MNQYRVSAEARPDLDEIWLYIAHDNPDAADNYIRAIVSRFPKLAAMPLIGRERPELSPSLRSFVVGHHVIFYRLFDRGVEVVRVLDGVRDLPPLFEQTNERHDGSRPDQGLQPGRRHRLHPLERSASRKRDRGEGAWEEEVMLGI